MGHSSRDFLVLALVVPDAWRYWIIPSGRPLLFQIFPSYSEIYRNIWKIHHRSVFLVINRASFSSHLLWSLVDVALFSSFYPLVLYSLLRLILFRWEGQFVMCDDRFRRLGAKCNYQILRECCRPFWNIGDQYQSCYHTFPNFVYFTCWKPFASRHVRSYFFNGHKFIAISHYNHRRFHIC